MLDRGGARTIPVYLTRVDGHAALGELGGASQLAGITEADARSARRPRSSATRRGKPDGRADRPRAGSRQRARSRPVRRATRAIRSCSPTAEARPSGPDHDSRRRDERGRVADLYKTADRCRPPQDAAVRHAARSASRACVLTSPRVRSSNYDGPSAGRPRDQDRRRRRARVARRRAARAVQRSSPARRGLLTTPPERDLRSRRSQRRRRGSRPASTRSAIARTAMVMDVFERVQREVPGARRPAHAQRARADPGCGRDPAVRHAEGHRLDAGDPCDVRHALGAGAHRRRARRGRRVRLAEAAEIGRDASPTARTSPSKSQTRCSASTPPSRGSSRTASLPADGSRISA